MFEWDKKLSVGIAKIDEQHKKLLDIGRELVSVLESTAEGYDEYDELKKLIIQLHDYTIHHFSEEEKLMKKADFVDLPAHRIQHEKFENKIKEIDFDELDENQYNYTMEILDFLSNWIVNHIIKIDTQYTVKIKEYLSDKT